MIAPRQRSDRPASSRTAGRLKVAKDESAVPAVLCYSTASVAPTQLAEIWVPRTRPQCDFQGTAPQRRAMVVRVTRSVHPNCQPGPPRRLVARGRREVATLKPATGACGSG